jgi:Pao retrotransposon peptidase/Putative peptidase (DUF1758)
MIVHPKKRCFKCHDKHHTRIHALLAVVPAREVTANVATIDNTSVMFSTINVYIRAADGKWYKARTLLDSGSSGNFMTKEMASLLAIKSRATAIIGSGFGDKSFNGNSTIVAMIRNHEGTYGQEVQFVVQDKLTGTIPHNYSHPSLFKIPKKYKLADPAFSNPGVIDLLIGNFLVKKIEKDETVHLDNGIDLYNTEFGWVVAGGIHLPSSPSVQTFSVNVASVSNLHELRQSIEKFYKFEDYKIKRRFLTQEEMICEQHFEQHVKRLDNGQFEVTVPLRASVKQLVNNYNSAYNQLLRSEKSLSKTPELKAQYDDFMREYRDLNHMSEAEASNDDPAAIVYYLPHHAVLKPDSSTTKVRVVFNASSQTASGVSFNDVQFTGPTVQTDTFLLHIDFRMHRYIGKADIAKAYRTVSVNPAQRDLQRILWRDESGIVKSYHLNTATYGTKSASFLVTRCIKQLAVDNREKYPAASKDLEDQTYVDDVFFGSDNINDLVSRAKDLIAITDSAQMSLRRFIGNSEEFNASIQENKRETSKDNSSVFKALGILWNSEADTIGFASNKIDDSTITKRVCLSEISKIFDPNGLLGPVTFNFKQFLKNCHQDKTNWDDTLSSSLQEKWKVLVESMQHLNEITLPRFASIEKATSLQLHGFSDASNEGYGAVIFLRSSDNNGNVNVQLLCSKSRITSDEMRMPRLELCSGVILAHLMSLIGDHLGIAEQYCWMDSMIALYWISKEPANLQPFVANRVNEIQTVSGHCRWSHVAGIHNPADLISRGLTVEQLVNNKFWWNGPEFLVKSLEEWPISKLQFDVNDPQHTCELRKLKVFAYKTASWQNDLIDRAASQVAAQWIRTRLY